MLDDSSMLDQAMEKPDLGDVQQPNDASMNDTLNKDMEQADTFDLDNAIGDVPDLPLPPSPSRGGPLDVSSDLNLSTASNTNNLSRVSLDLALANEEEDEKNAAKGTRQKKKRKIGRDSVTELNSATMKKV